MSTDSTWRKLLAAFRGRPSKKDWRLEELVSITTGTVTPTERIEPSETLMRRCELLYRMEPLIFSSVNKLTRRITGTRIYFTGPNPDENAKAYQFLKDSNLLNLLPDLVRDAFIYGFGVAEIVKKGKKVTLVQIDPKEFDYIRDGSEIAFDENGRLKGFVWKHLSEERELRPEQVLLIRFFRLGNYCLGISPIETAFKAAWVKLNLEEALGEAIYRHGFPLLKFKLGTPTPGPWQDITPEKIKEAKKLLKNLESGSEIILPWWMDVDILTGRGEFGNVHQFILTLSMEILAAFEQPKSFTIARGALGGRDIEELDFEKAVLTYQQELKRQLEEQLLDPYFKQAGFITHPELTFAEYAPELQNLKLRRLSAYAKHGLITRTNQLENALLEAEGLPVKEQKMERKTECIFELGKCPVREEEDIPLDKLVAFCNICIRRLKEEKTVRQ